MSEYPNIDNFNIQSAEELITWVNGDLKNWIKEVTRLRYEDTGDKDTLPDMYVRGRKSPRIPSSPTDVTDFDKVGDISYDGQWLYVLVEVSDGVLQWARTQLSAANPWPVPQVLEKATTPDAEDGTDDDKFMTALKTLRSIEYNGLGGKGFEWQNMVGSRIAGQWYHNTEDYPIATVIDVAGSTGTHTVYLSDDGGDTQFEYWTNALTGCFALVPSGYSIRLNSGTPSVWRELRRV